MNVARFVASFSSFVNVFGPRRLDLGHDKCCFRRLDLGVLFDLDYLYVCKYV